MKLILDIILLFLFGIMCNTSTTGTVFHEVAGLVYTALVIVHLILNRWWIAALFKGKLRGGKSVTMAFVNIALLLNLLVILITGIRTSHFLFPADVKASSRVIVVHVIGGVIAAGLLLTHVLLHTKMITKKKPLRKVALVVILTVVIGYSLYGSIQGVMHHSLPKEGKSDTQQHDNGNHRPKDGEKK